MTNLLPISVQQGDLLPHKDHDEYFAIRKDEALYLPTAMSWQH